MRGPAPVHPVRILPNMILEVFLFLKTVTLQTTKKIFLVVDLDCHVYSINEWSC